MHWAVCVKPQGAGQEAPHSGKDARIINLNFKTPQDVRVRGTFVGACRRKAQMQKATLPAETYARCEIHETSSARRKYGRLCLVFLYLQAPTRVPRLLRLICCLDLVFGIPIAEAILCLLSSRGHCVAILDPLAQHHLILRVSLGNDGLADLVHLAVFPESIAMHDAAPNQFGREYSLRLETFWKPAVSPLRSFQEHHGPTLASRGVASRLRLVASSELSDSNVSAI